jgi:hypothetical protein
MMNEIKTIGYGNLSLSIDTTVGSVIISPMITLPREMDLPITSVESIGGWHNRALEWFERHIPGFTRPSSINGGLQAQTPWSQGQGVYWKSLITYVGGSGVMYNPSAVYGNNNIQGDSGNDTLVGGRIWGNTLTWTQSSIIDDGKTRALSFAESASTRLSLLAHQIDQLHRINYNEKPTTATPACATASSINIITANDIINGLISIHIAVTVMHHVIRWL